MVNNQIEEKTKQYNGEDVYCTDGYNMVTETLAFNGKIFVTGYRKDLFNNVWVQQWVMLKGV